MGAEIRVQIILAGHGASIENRCEDMIRELNRSIKYVSLVDVYPEGVETMTAEFECEPKSEWGDIRDRYSSSGTRGGLIETYEPAKAEIEMVMKKLYLDDIADDWEIIGDLPEDKVA